MGLTYTEKVELAKRYVAGDESVRQALLALGREILLLDDEQRSALMVWGGELRVVEIGQTPPGARPEYHAAKERALKLYGEGMSIDRSPKKSA